MRDEEFERLYELHAGPLYSFLAYRTGDRVLAEEVLGETWERVLRGRSRFDRRRASEKTWIYTIALNCLRDQVRRRGAEARAVERSAVAAAAREGGPDRALEQVERRDQLGRALAALSTEEQEAVALRFGADLTVPEIAELLEQPLTTVEGRVYRALRKLRDELA